MAQLIV